MDAGTFSQEVGAIVKQQYGYDDGADLCYQLIELGEINPQGNPQGAARMVALRLEQA